MVILLYKSQRTAAKPSYTRVSLFLILYISILKIYFKAGRTHFAPSTSTTMVFQTIKGQNTSPPLTRHPINTRNYLNNPRPIFGAALSQARPHPGHWHPSAGPFFHDPPISVLPKPCMSILQSG